ncbi:S8 family serine peptidase [Bacillus sp. EB106-08-02-XG196]|uniref:S8 family serine peptidase n=1 Tax=Bacillus sp. EB106-08-02-XG196 TaxID=2737049 RepID=UPI0015C4804D|nr:S8 family serine peptidase [Bacillus sp. EB106-08-02-XG196]
MKKVGFLLFALCFLTIAGCKATEEPSRLTQKAAEEAAMHNPKISKWMNQHHPRNGTTYLVTGQNNQNSEDLYTKSITSNDHHWKITYTSKTEISPNKMEVTVNSTTGEIESIQEEERMIVQFKQQVNEEAIHDVNGEIINTVETITVLTAYIPVDKIEEIKQNPEISTIEKDARIRATSQVVDWGNEKIRTPIAWQASFTGKGQKIAILDSGVSTSHEDLKITDGVAFVPYTTSYDDDNGHGTHVAGIIGAANNTKGTVGVAPDASLYAVKVLDNNGEGYVSDIIAGIDWAVQNDIDIINLSIGSDTPSNMLKDVLDMAYSKGILIVASAGNTGYEPYHSTVGYPAAYDSVIAVGAIDQSNKWADFSSVGPTVEVTSPGVDILSTYLNNSTKRLTGTSMAAPFVSGLLALLKEQYPELSAADLRSILQKNVIDLGDAGRDPYYGYGLVQYSERIKDIQRVSGKNRFELAVNISKAGWQESSHTVVLTNYISFADALASSPLAFKENAPILLTHKDFLTSETKEEIQRLKPQKVIVIGGPGSISESVIDSVSSLGIATVERIGGKDRFEVAYHIAQRMGATNTAIIANGLNFPDALAIAPYAARNGYIFILTTKDSIPNNIKRILQEKGIQHTIVVGGEGSVSEAVVSRLPQPIRINGKDRFEVAGNIIENLQITPEILYFATGYSFADAMTGSVLAAKENGAMLLTSPTNLPLSIQQTVKATNLTKYKILGGTGSISENVYMQLMFEL